MNPAVAVFRGSRWISALAATISNANLITVTGETTSPAGVLGGVVSYTPPTTASMVSATTLAITFTAGFLPDRTCYIVTIGAGALGQPLSGDNNVMVRALEGDATGSGDVMLSDAILTKTKATLPVASNVRYDMNLDADHHRR